MADTSDLRSTGPTRGVRAGDFILLLVAALVLAACGGSANETAEETTALAATTAPSGPATTTTTTAAASTTTTTAAASTTTTIMIEAVEVSVMFSELSSNFQMFTAAICTVATDPNASIFATLGIEDFQQAVQQVATGMTGVPELADAWLELANAGADANEFLDAAVPICVAIGWSPEN